MNAKQVLTEFCESIEARRAEFHFFRTVDGEPHQGWIMSVEGDKILYHSSGPMVDPDLDIRIPVAEVDLETLEYYDPEEQKWVKFPPES